MPGLPTNGPCHATLGIKLPTNTAQDLTDLGEKLLLTDKCLVRGFESIVVHGHMQNTMMMGHCLNVMIQVPYPDEKAELPNGLYVMRTYTELKDSSRSVTVVLRNITARPIHLTRGQLIGWVVVANIVPKVEYLPELLQKLDEENPKAPMASKLGIKERQEILLTALKKDGGLDCLKDWPPEVAEKHHRTHHRAPEGQAVQGMV